MKKTNSFKKLCLLAILMLFSMQSNAQLKIGTNVEIKGELHAASYWTNLGVKVWPDYVFENKYNLTPLSQVEQYLKTNNHLENIPSADEVMANGFELSSINIKLLEKVEELTLYIIEINKSNEKRNELIAQLLKENEQLKSKTGFIATNN